MKEYKIYVASLSDYNNGVLHGVWIDLSTNTEDQVWQAIRDMLAASPTTKRYGDKAEEWAIHDYEGIPSDFGEYASISTLMEYVEAVEEHGEKLEAARSYHSSMTVEELVEYVENNFIDTADSTKEFAENYAVERGLLRDNNGNDTNPLFAYIDWDWYWTGELQHSITEIEYGGTIYFFNS